MARPALGQGDAGQLVAKRLHLGGLARRKGGLQGSRAPGGRCAEAGGLPLLTLSTLAAALTGLAARMARLATRLSARMATA